MKIKDVARLTGLTVRTLQYYDDIQLVQPSRNLKNGYREYGQSELEKLQQIMLLRELAFPLEDVRRIMANPGYDRHEALKRHRTLLIKKRDRLDALIALVDRTMKGDTNLDFKAFDAKDIEETKKQYAEEVRQRWGNTEAYRESEKRSAAYGKKEWTLFNGEGEELLRAFGEARTQSPDSEQALALVKRWQSFITERFYPCTDEILAGLGQMYIGDERFTQNIDRFGEGTAQFMSRAIEAYCAK